MNLTLTLSTKLPSHMAGTQPTQQTFKGPLAQIIAEAFDELNRARLQGVFDAGGCVDIVVQLERPELFHPRT